MMRKVPGTAFAIAAALVAGIAGPNGVAAEEPTNRTTAEVPDLDVQGTVMVVNNHRYDVTIYAVDDDGVSHRLGELGRSDVEAFTVPDAALSWDGTAVIKVYPASPTPGLGVPATARPGIKTRINLSGGSQAVFWLEPELTRSFTESLGG